MAKHGSVESASRPSWKRRVLVGFGLLTSVVCLIIIVALIAVHTSPVRRLVADRVAALLASQDVDFRADEFGYNLFHASVNLHNVRVRPTTWPDAPVFATIARVRINLSLFQLLRGRVVVQSGTAEEVDVHYVVDEQGRDNLPRPPRSPTDADASRTPPNYLVSTFSIAKARVRYENRQQQIDAQLPLSSIDVSGSDLTNRHEVQFTAAGGEVQVQDRRAGIDRLTGQVDLGEDDVSIDRLEVETVGSRADVAGTITSFDAPVADLIVKLNVDAMRVAPLALVNEPVGGSITIDGAAMGPLSAPVLTARVSVAAFHFRDLRDLQLNAMAAYDPSIRQARVSSLELRAPWGVVTGQSTVAFSGSGQSNVNADITSVDAAALMRALHLPYVAATRVDGTLRAEWPGLDYLKARGTAEATLRSTASDTEPSAMPLSGRLVARGDGGRIDAQLLQMAVPGAEVNGLVEVTSNGGLQGKVTGRSPDVGQLVSSVEALTGRPPGSLLPTPVRGGANVDARLGGSLAAPTAAAAISAPALEAGTINGIALKAEASYSTRIVTIGRADLTWEQAGIRLDGRVGIDRDQPIDLTLSADDLRVESWLAAMNQAELPISGLITAKGSVGGSIAKPTAMITATGSNLVAYEEHIGTLDATVRMEGHELTISDLVINKPQPEQTGRLSATGTYDLNRNTYTFDVQSAGLQLLGAVLPDGRRVRADVQTLTARGAGDIASPEGTFDLDVSALEIDAPRDTPSGQEGDPTHTSRLGRVIVNGIAQNHEATITASAEQFNLDARAVVGLAKPWPATLTMRASNLDLAALPLPSAPATPSVEPSRLQGQLRATIDASGNLSELERGQATVALETLAGTWNGRPFTVTSPSPLRYADERLTVDMLKVEGIDSSLTISGDLPLTDQAAAGQMSIDLRGTLATLTQYAPPDTNISGDGAVTLMGSLRGTLERIEPDLTLTVDNGLILSPQLQPGFSNIVLRARIENGAADIEQLDAKWGTATLQVSGRIPLDAVPQLPLHVPRERGPATLKAVISGLDPSSIPNMPAQLSGRISAEADLSATSADLSALDGRVTFQELDVRFEGLDLAQQQPSTIAIASGSVMVDQFTLTGSAGTITAGGRIGLDAQRALDLNVDGTLNIAALSILTDGIRTEGDSTVKLVARGTLTAPELTGTVDVMNGTAISNEPRIAAENLNAHLDLTAGRISLTRLEADVNGGTVNASGSVTLGEGVVRDVDLEMSAKDVAFDAPLNLRSISNGDIRVARAGDTIVVKGKVSIEEAGLTDDVRLDAGLLAEMNARRSRNLVEQRNPLLDRVRFDIDVVTATPVLVENNLARAEITTDLHIVGTAYEPGLLGSLTLLEGSEILLNERRYEAERGVITFVDERRILPSFDLRLNTSVSSYDVTIVVTGTPDNTETTLTSTPTLPEPDILAMLMTGRTLDEMRGEEFEVAREQMFSSLAGRVGSTVGRGLQQATGFSEVRLEPTLIANEADPSARLTIGQQVTNNLKVVYSANLTDSNDQIWVVEYDLTRRFRARGVWQDDGSFRFDFRRDVRFGGQPEPRSTNERIRSKISEVSVTVDGGDESAVRDKLRVKAGDTYDFFEIRNGIQRVEDSLIEQGYLQSRVRLERQVEGQRAQLRLHVTLGPRVEIEITGARPPRRVERTVRAQWHRGVFDKQRGDDGAETLREWLMADNYLQAKVEYQIEDVTDQERRVVFQIEPGVRSRRIVLAFEGASAINPDELDRVIEQQKLERQLFTDPAEVTDLLQRYYHTRGYLSAQIDEPRFEFDDGPARVVLPVQEGPEYTVGSITVSGNTVFETEDLVSQLSLVAGDPFLPPAAENALVEIRGRYWAKGYNEVRLDYELAMNRATGEVNVAFTVTEGRQSVIADISIAGNQRVSDRLVREQIQLSPAEPLDLGALARSRRRLYGTGGFSLVDITRQELEDVPVEEPKQVHLDVDVKEVPPFQLRYGASYDTEGGLGGILDLSNHNSLGGARVFGLQSRYDGQLTDVRVYITQPALTYRHETTLSVYLREDRNPPTEITNPFDISRKGVSLQQQRRLRDRYVWSYGYKYERPQTLTPTPTDVIEETVSISPLTSTLTRETRDDVLDASTGAFLSQSFSFSPTWLGSDDPYVKYYGQYFHLFPLQRPRTNPFTNMVVRPRFVYATGVRLGLAWGLDGEFVTRSERFFAGGSGTMRGFQQNTVGPITPDGFALGGQALLVLNNELRVPLVGIIDGVFFTDIGNVYATVGEFSLGNLRQSVGVGLRIRTSWLLLRGDYGFVVDPRPGESRGQFYFSVGQAF